MKIGSISAWFAIIVLLSLALYMLTLPWRIGCAYDYYSCVLLVTSIRTQQEGDDTPPNYLSAVAPPATEPMKQPVHSFSIIFAIFALLIWLPIDQRQISAIASDDDLVNGNLPLSKSCWLMLQSGLKLTVNSINPT
jgi:hypothetical protein